MARKKTETVAEQTTLTVAPEKVEVMEFLATVVLSIDKTAQSGQVVEVRAEPDNPADPKALAIYAGEDKIGYLANKSATVRPDTKSAAALHKMVTNKKTAKVFARLSEPKTIVSGKAELESFQAALYFVPQRAEGKKASSELTFETYGASISAPHRAGLIKRLEEGDEKTAEVELTQASRGSQINIHLADHADPLNDTVGIVKAPEPDDDAAAERYSKLRNALAAGWKPSGIVTLVDVKSINGSTAKGLSVTVDLNNNSNKEAVNAAIDRVISRCIEQANTLEAKVKFMRSSGLSDDLICKVLDGYKLYEPEFEAMVPAPEHPFVDDNKDPVFSRVMGYHLHGKHIRLVGEKGCGKNTLVETVDWLLRRPLFRLAGNSDMDKTDILGSRTIENGNMTYELTDFLRVLEVGGDVDLDECNAIKPDVELIIHSLTDDARSIQVPGYGKVKMDNRASFWMTMNEDYIGTSDMNDATIDRFVTIRMKSPSNIKDVLKARVPDAPEHLINYCDKVYKDVLRSVQNGELSSTCVSIRGLVDALECADCIPLSVSLLDTLAAKPQDSSERTALEAIISNLGEP